MGKQSLEYRLLHPTQPVDPRTEVVIIHSVERLAACMVLLGQQGKPKIVVDNNIISMRTPTSKMVTAVGYVPRGNVLYLYWPTANSIKVPLEKPLEEMTQEEINAFDEPNLYGIVSPQLLVALRDYVLEQHE